MLCTRQLLFTVDDSHETTQRFICDLFSTTDNKIAKLEINDELNCEVDIDMEINLFKDMKSPICERSFKKETHCDTDIIPNQQYSLENVHFGKH
jgi:hypothetical protein